MIKEDSLGDTNKLFQQTNYEAESSFGKLKWGERLEALIG